MEHHADPKALERLGLCFAMIAHEVRNALTPVQAQCELALRDKPTGRAKAALEYAARASVEAVEAMQTILDAAAGNVSTGPAGVDVAAVVARVLHDHQAAASRVRASVPRGTLGRSDAAALRLAVGNLVRNALEADPGRATRVSIQADAKDGYIRLLVSDDGPGLPSSASLNRFVPFQRSTTGGSGLGLAIAASVLQAHGTTLTLEKTGPDGTCWLISIPCMEAASAAA